MVIKSQELIPLFEKFAGASFVGIVSKTTPKLLKKGRSGKSIPDTFGCLAEDIAKVSNFSAGIGYDYAKAIQNRLIKEGKEGTEYKAGESWHTAHNGSKVIREHKKTGELYFYVSLNTRNVPKSEYINKVTGEVLSRDELSEFLPAPSAPMNQGLEEGNEVEVRTLKLNSIVSLSACGEVYEVTNS
jgi:hypothetical protein